MFKFKARKKTGQAEEVEEKDLMMKEIALTEKENPNSEWFVLFRYVSRGTLPNIYDGTFCENS